MNNDFSQQELLIMTNTSFTAREWCCKNESRLFSQKEQFKQACWDGLVPQMLPECFNSSKQLQLWEMNEADAFIDLEYGKFLAKKEKKYSVNPYEFLVELDYN
jgi:hypothetical protein